MPVDLANERSAVIRRIGRFQLRDMLLLSTTWRERKNEQFEDSIEGDGVRRRCKRTRLREISSNQQAIEAELPDVRRIDGCPLILSP